MIRQVTDWQPRPNHTSISYGEVNMQQSGTGRAQNIQMKRERDNTEQAVLEMAESRSRSRYSALESAGCGAIWTDAAVQVSHYKSNKLMHLERQNFKCTSNQKFY